MLYISPSTSMEQNACKPLPLHFLPFPPSSLIFSTILWYLTLASTPPTSEQRAADELRFISNELPSYRCPFLLYTSKQRRLFSYPPRNLDLRGIACPCSSEQLEIISSSYAIFQEFQTCDSNRIYWGIWIGFFLFRTFVFHG